MHYEPVTHVEAATDVKNSLNDTALPGDDQSWKTRFERMEAQLKELSTREPTVTNHHNTNNIIVLQNFGEEDLSYLSDPIDYLERTHAGLRALLHDIYFNASQKQNYTARIKENCNAAELMAEVHQNGNWKTTSMPVVADRMIGNCKTYIVSGFNATAHHMNDNVKEFISNVVKRQEATDYLRSDINHGLLERARNGENP